MSLIASILKDRAISKGKPIFLRKSKVRQVKKGNCSVSILSPTTFSQVTKKSDGKELSLPRKQNTKVFKGRELKSIMRNRTKSGSSKKRRNNKEKSMLNYLRYKLNSRQRSSNKRSEIMFVLTVMFRLISYKKTLLIFSKINCVQPLI